MKKIQVFTIVSIFVLGVIVGTITSRSGKKTSEVNASTDSSQAEVVYDYCLGLDNNGFIKDNAETCLGEVSLEGMGIDVASLEPTADDVNDYMNNIAKNYAEYSDNVLLTAQTGDTVRIDYSGYLDESKDVLSASSDEEVTIGSGDYVNGFEDSIIGLHPGESTVVNVTFPADFGDEHINGKSATFTITLNSIKVVPEMTDEIASRALGKDNGTIAELEESVKLYLLQLNLHTAIYSYINSIETDSLPEEYYNNKIKMIRAADDEEAETYAKAYGLTDVTFASLCGYTEEEYEASLERRASESVKAELFFQAIFKKYISDTLPEETYNNWTKAANLTQDKIESYGEPYVKQSIIMIEAMNYIYKQYNAGEAVSQYELLSNLESIESSDEVSPAATTDTSVESSK
ncbi:FKBP-type peptidyl-prolyl cis-trans isomerase [Butyrivibrio fibrisolvens]|uniref:FKBP-type peptidyl-prolyl cis-trans isomerase n=1 Tax=Butyrivibrio fibrisolvens TaxID=831 RepID=UPI0003B6DBD8|nr:FKBP-type peptidyl-prolyl cis-trans isomerase [Butyrivibrio fibrisolvens]